MNFFLLGLATLIGVWALLSWGKTAQPKQLLKSLKWIALGIAGAVLFLVLITKNINFIWAFAAAALPWISRFRWMRNMWKSMRGPSAGQRSEISCRFFDMHLDHDSGAMDGRIREGGFEGALLSELSLDEGRTLYAEVRNSGDDRSIQLLEAYLDRRHGSDWRREDEERRDDTRRRSATRDDMSRKEALDLLGLEDGATADEIKAAHRKLMKQVHPDAGGSAYLAAKVNRAKDLLLG